MTRVRDLMPAAQGDALSDAVRVPLDSLHADAAYLIGRLREGSMPYARVIEIIRERIDAAKAAIRARASHGQAPAGATPECLTCSDHGAVGNILTAEPCPDCTRLNTQPTDHISELNLQIVD